MVEKHHYLSFNLHLPLGNRASLESRSHSASKKLSTTVSQETFQRPKIYVLVPELCREEVAPPIFEYLPPQEFRKNPPFRPPAISCALLSGSPERGRPAPRLLRRRRRHLRYSSARALLSSRPRRPPTGKGASPTFLLLVRHQYRLPLLRGPDRNRRIRA